MNRDVDAKVVDSRKDYDARRFCDAGWKIQAPGTEPLFVSTDLSVDTAFVSNRRSGPVACETDEMRQWGIT
jgi:hypothetical protein